MKKKGRIGNTVKAGALVVAVLLLFAGCDPFGLFSVTEDEAAEAVITVVMGTLHAILEDEYSESPDGTTITISDYDVSELIEEIEQEVAEDDYEWQQDFETISGTVSQDNDAANWDFEFELTGGAVDDLEFTHEEDEDLEEEMVVTANGDEITITGDALGGNWGDDDTAQSIRRSLDLD